MVAPVDIHGALLAKIRAAFDTNCPDIPPCRARVEEVFSEIGSMTHEDGESSNLYRLAMLADELGLELDFRMERRKP